MSYLRAILTGVTSQAQTDARRAAFLRALYDETGANTLLGRVQYVELGQRLGMDEAESTAISMFLKDRGLGTFAALGGAYAITPAGVDQVETWNRETEGRADSSGRAAVLSVAEVRSVEAAVTALQRSEVVDKLDGDDRAEYESDLDTVSAQIRSPRPKRAILKAALARLAEFAILTGSSGLGTVLANAIQ